MNAQATDSCLASWIESMMNTLARRLQPTPVCFADTQSAPDVVPLTQEELAEMAGTSRATVNRVLRDEQERGTVELRRGKTVVTDVQALARRGR